MSPNTNQRIGLTADSVRDVRSNSQEICVKRAIFGKVIEECDTWISILNRSEKLPTLMDRCSIIVCDVLGGYLAATVKQDGS